MATEQPMMTRKKQALREWGRETGFCPDAPQSKAQWNESWRGFLDKLVQEKRITQAMRDKWKDLPPSEFNDRGRGVTFVD